MVKASISQGWQVETHLLGVIQADRLLRAMGQKNANTNDGYVMELNGGLENPSKIVTPTGDPDLICQLIG